MSLPVLEAIEKNARSYEPNPSPEARLPLLRAREDARGLLAAALRVTPEELVLTRNTTEGNNFVSSGLTLGNGVERIEVRERPGDTLDGPPVPCRDLLRAAHHSYIDGHCHRWALSPAS